MAVSHSIKLIAAAGLLAGAGAVLGHGNVTPQPVDTGNLPELGEELLAENPFRAGNDKGNFHEEAVAVGKRAYTGNCQNCHGIEVVSGGLTPDLRELTEWDDEYFIGRVTHGTDRGMPSFKRNLNQNAMWAIKTYIESVKE
ncbi:cytochrome c-550 PedF [Marinobacter xestospongiae]|uniref:Cytochrome c-550 PedF n=1 Tax=Marinobacter xestospongiae TaxID=994319 RepID=A0ABU3W180_9GAMM|nr:cytochrome c-550 PedF [Marinobacter xestospongiae]MDV2080293.1 cytochrome c-550 PedF [Marinobacter xestospongiae]